MSKQYTTDWLTAFLPQWDEHLFHLPSLGSNAIALEVGTYEGRSACHLMYAYPGLQLDVVDYFVDPYNEGFEARFDHNMAEYAGRFRKIKGKSEDILPQLLNDGSRYDFIYIDGDHSYEATKPALETCWQMLNPDGVLFLDDYNDHLRKNPFKFGVDSAVNEFFLSLPREEFRVLSNVHLDYQFYVRKTSGSL